MVGYMLDTIKATSKDFLLYRAIRIVQFDIPHISYHLFSMLEL